MKTSSWIKLLLSIQGSWKPIPSSIAAGIFPDLSCTWDITAVSAHISAAGTGAAGLDWVFMKLELEIISKHSGNSTTLPALSYCARAAGDAQVVQLWDASLSLPCSVCDTDMPRDFGNDPHATTHRGAYTWGSSVSAGLGPSSHQGSTEFDCHYLIPVGLW